MIDPMEEKTLNTRRIFEGRALTIDVLDIELPTGRTSTREVLRHRGAVCILAQHPDGDFVLVRQYRKAVGKTLLECVAGCMEAGEAPESAALRETREESGYEVETLFPLGKSLPAPVLETRSSFASKVSFFINSTSSAEMKGAVFE